MVEAEPTENQDSDYAKRRLIIVVVTPGDDPSVETEPPESFATWELIAALKRAVEMIEQDDIMLRVSLEDEEDE